MNKLFNVLGAVNLAVPDTLKQFSASFGGVVLAETQTPDSIGDAKKHLISVGVAIISQIAFTLSKKLIDGINRKFANKKNKVA